MWRLPCAFALPIRPDFLLKAEAAKLQSKLSIWSVVASNLSWHHVPDPRSPRPDEVETLLRNAELRERIEPYRDESMMWMRLDRLPTAKENEYLESMLAWELAPLLPVAEWFHPPLRLPQPSTLSDDALHQVLWETIHKLYEQQIVLDFTDHLDDRQLYRIILRDILPSLEKKIDSPRFLHWDCANATGNEHIWLKYYASDEERRSWAKERRQRPPPSEQPRYRRELPKAPR